MKKIASLIFFVGIGSSSLFAQSPVWSTDIASIIYNNCTVCHHEGGIAPFSLITYQNAVDNAYSIQAAVVSKLMPPWLPDPSYAHFKDEKILEQDEIDLISEWVDSGALSGDLGLAPPAPVYNGALLLNNVDDTVEIPHYTITQDIDDYRSFVLHSNYTDTMYINQLQFIPGDPSVVHHCFIFQDPTPDSYQKEIDDVTDTLPGWYASGMGGFASTAAVFTGYIPGTDPIKFPVNWGYVIPDSADYCFSFHYGPGSLGKTDSSKMYLKFCEAADSLIRPVYNRRLLWWYDSSLLNPPFFIHKNTIDTFWEVSPDFHAPMSIVAMQPHMHLIGKSIRAWMVSPDGTDTTNLIYIPRWDWNWQGNYFVTKLIKIDSGALIYDEGIYDNTVNNPNNPNNPPINVHSGEGTEDEMMAIRFSLLDYMPGDEDYILDSAFYGLPTSNGGYSVSEYDLGVKVFPNPAKNELWFSTWLPVGELHWTLTSLAGVVVQEEHKMKIWKGAYTGEINISELPPGVYLFTIKSGQERAIRKVVIEK